MELQLRARKLKNRNIQPFAGNRNAAFLSQTIRKIPAADNATIESIFWTLYSADSTNESKLVPYQVSLTQAIIIESDSTSDTSTSRNTHIIISNTPIEIFTWKRLNHPEDGTDKVAAVMSFFEKTGLAAIWPNPSYTRWRTMKSVADSLPW